MWCVLWWKPTAAAASKLDRARSASRSFGTMWLSRCFDHQQTKIKIPHLQNKFLHPAIKNKALKELGGLFVPGLLTTSPMNILQAKWPLSCQVGLHRGQCRTSDLAKSPRWGPLATGPAINMSTWHGARVPPGLCWSLVLIACVECWSLVLIACVDRFAFTKLIGKKEIKRQR